MKIDLHNHTTISSSCSILDVEDLIKRAIELGIDAIAVTEHLTMEGGIIAQKIAREKYGYIVFPGIEARCYEGDFLVFGSKTTYFDVMPLSKLSKIVRNEGGIVIAAHPYRFSYSYEVGEEIEMFKAYCDAIEVLNGNCNNDMIMAAYNAAIKSGLPMVGGSDAHSIDMVGRYYTFFEDEINDIDSLASAIKNGRCYIKI